MKNQIIKTAAVKEKKQVGELIRERCRLSGINRKCAQCINTCKQYEQVSIIACPNFRGRSLSAKKHSTSKLGKTPTMPQDVK